MSRDRELEAGTAAHYEDPAYYTKTYQRRVEDVRYYVDLAVERRARVIELGCGNGRIAIPLARNGVEVIGVDKSPTMVTDLKTRLRDEPDDVRARVDVRRGDMRSVRLGAKAPLVFCAFNTLLHLYTRRDVERFLETVKVHLAKGGELVFDVSIPQPEELARDPARLHKTPRFSYPTADGKGQLVSYGERFDYDPLRQVLFVSMEFSPVDGSEGWMTPLAHRQFFPQELEALLHYNGFAITKQLGDFFGGAPTRESVTWLVHAKRR